MKRIINIKIVMSGFDSINIKCFIILMIFLIETLTICIEIINQKTSRKY